MRHNLPAELANFVGREHEVTEIKRLVLQTRLLTLTGVGGSGKTRLALRVAAGLAPSFMDGVWLVQLAPVDDSGLVEGAVASAVGVHGVGDQPVVATLVTALASRRLLLVLDNCEHLIGAVARLAESLLGACPHLRILATSREPLRVPGETTWRVPPLALPREEPEGGCLAPDRLAEVESVALFLDRARARERGFSLTTRNAQDVATICRRLEGLPLAIELAAARVGVLPPSQIAGLLDGALRVLGGGSRTEPRQETLRGALDWSYDLLGQSEQALLRRLSTFAGGFDVDAVVGVCGGDGIEPADVLQLLTALVEKSLVEPQPLVEEARYRLLEPVRQYASEHLSARGERDDYQRRHARYFVDLAEEAEPELRSGGRRTWMEHLAREQDNLRTALEWSRQADKASDRELGVRLAGALVFYWHFRGEVREGLHWVEAALACGLDASRTARAKALYCACELAWLAGQTTLARERVEESVALFRAIGDRRGLAYALQSLPMSVDHPQAGESVAESLRLFDEIGDVWGRAMALAAQDLFALVGTGDPTGQGQARLEEAVTRFRQIDDDWGTAQALNMLGDLARSQGNDAIATAWYGEALALLRRQDLTGTVPSLLHNLGYLALRRDDVRQALRLFRESLTLFRDQGDQRGIADCVTGLGCVLAGMGQPERAAELFGAADAMRQTTGTAIWPANVADYERGLQNMRSRIDEGALAARWAAGRAQRLEQVLDELKNAVNEHKSGTGSDLTVRERDVVALVAQGLTNRQIGARLFITAGTAGLHVKHILQKLGFTSRAQIAAWAVEQGLTVGAEAQ
ncbi:MAG TPA: tetratricopeptide repeat protein [Chloroflexota bacterium]